MVSLKSLLPTLPLFLLATSQPIDIDTPTDTSGALEERGLGWLENSRGTEAYRCEYFPNPFFEKIHLAGRNSSHTEREFKKAAKKAGAVTGWKWKETGEEGGFDVKFNLPVVGHFFLEKNLYDLVHVQHLCANDLETGGR